jgi:hypothetical protein
MFQGPFGPQFDQSFVNILSREASGEVVAHEGRHEGQTSIGGAAYLDDRATKARLALGGRLASVFLCIPLFHQKSDALFFP